MMSPAKVATMVAYRACRSVMIGFADTLHRWVGVLTTERNGSVSGAGDVEVEREVLTRGLHVAQEALQRVAGVDGVGAVARPQGVDRLARLGHRECVLGSQAKLRLDAQFLIVL